jgi:hypothetical protein
MTRDDLKFQVLFWCGIATSVAGGISIFPWVPPTWQHGIAIVGFLATIIGGKLGNSPLPGDWSKR